MLTISNIIKSILKTLGIMSRLVLILIFCGSICTNIIYANEVVGQNVYDVQIKIQSDNSTVSEIFTQIEDQTDFEFLYTFNLLDNVNNTFSFHLDTISVANFLSKVSEETGLWFWQLKNSISVGTQQNWPKYQSGVLICSDNCPKELNGEGALKGTILDSRTKSPIYGATILMDGTSIGTATDEEGEFILRKLPAGEQNFTIRFLGYKSQNKAIEILSDEVTDIEILLEPDLVEGEDINVYSQALGQAQAIREQVSSTSLINVVSESKIRELPDANAAESVGRLPGVSVIRESGEGQLIAIRGLAPRHNSITIDGDRIPSSGESGRSVNLSTISPEMLSGIEVFKAIRPDMDADAIGGSINFKFAGVPNKKALRVNTSSGYHNHINSVGSYNISVNGSQRFFKGKLGVLTAVDLERNDRSSDSFNASYLVLRDARENEENALIGVNGISLSDKSSVRDRFGTGIIIDYRLPNDGSIMFNNFASRLDQETINRTRRYSINTFTQSLGINDVETQTDVISTRLSGIHNVLNSKIEWKVSRNLSRDETPYNHSVNFEELGAFNSSELDETEGPLSVTKTANNNVESMNFDGSTFVNTLINEEDWAARADITIPIRIGEQVDGIFKVGGKAVVKDRERTGRDWKIRSGDAAFIYTNEDREWIFTDIGRLSIKNFLNESYEPARFLDGKYNFPVQIDRNAIQDLWDRHSENHIERLTIVFDDQKATERINSVYGLTEVNIFNRFTLLPGVRYEYTDSEYIAKTGEVSGSYRNIGNIVDTVATQTFGNLFPMAHLRINVSSWFDIRAAYTETISRPNFSELLPREEVSANSRSVRRGGPSLKPASSTNYDLFLTLYGNKTGLFSIGGFYKSIDDLIYPRIAIILDPVGIGLEPQTLGYELYESINNPNETTVRGIELEWQSNLMHLAPPFNGLVLNLNYTRIWSETKYPQFVLERTSEGIIGKDVYREGPMINQPDYVFNVSVGYDLNKFSSRISLLYQGETLTGIGERKETDSFTEDFLKIDAAIKYSLSENFDLFGNVQNLNNEPDQATQFTNQFFTFEQYYSWIFEAGVRLSL